MDKLTVYRSNKWGHISLSKKDGGCILFNIWTGEVILDYRSVIVASTLGSNINEPILFDIEKMIDIIWKEPDYFAINSKIEIMGDVSNKIMIGLFVNDNRNTVDIYGMSSQYSIDHNIMPIYYRIIDTYHLSKSKTELYFNNLNILQNDITTCSEQSFFHF